MAKVLGKPELRLRLFKFIIGNALVRIGYNLFQ